MLIDFLFMYFILLKSVVHKHERGTRLSTCLVYTSCVVAFDACENADKFSVYVPDFIEVNYARAWTRHAPWYVPCVAVVCLVCRDLCCMHQC